MSQQPVGEEASGSGSLAPIWLGVGSPRPQPRLLQNSMFGHVADAFDEKSIFKIGQSHHGATNTTAAARQPGETTTTTTAATTTRPTTSAGGAEGGGNGTNQQQAAGASISIGQPAAKPHEDNSVDIMDVINGFFFIFAL